MTGQWASTGQRVEVPGQLDRTPEYDPRSGDHLWIIVTMYRWGGTETPILDGENLLMLQGPGCYYCEQPWTERLSKRRCKGTPR